MSVRSIKYRYDSENYRNFLCEYCEKDFFNRNDRYYHFIDQHTIGGVLKPYQRENCKKRFKRFRDLDKHKKSKEH